jgi:ABC-2 type transport system permease protein
MLIMFPLTFLSNAFVPTESLPVALRFFTDHINPLSKAVTAVRQLLSQGTAGADFWLALAGAMVILVVFAPLALRIYMKKE